MVCDVCDQQEHNPILAHSLNVNSSLYTFPHYLVLDTNVVLDQIHVLEEDILSNIIVLYTVLDEVKHKSSSVYVKFKDIIANKSRNVYIFVNEHHRFVINSYYNSKSSM